MISIEKTGICEGCDCKKLYILYDGCSFEEICCEHEAACKRIEEMFTKKDTDKASEAGLMSEGW